MVTFCLSVRLTLLLVLSVFCYGLLLGLLHIFGPVGDFVFGPILLLQYILLAWAYFQTWPWYLVALSPDPGPRAWPGLLPERIFSACYLLFRYLGIFRPVTVTWPEALFGPVTWPDSSANLTLTPCRFYHQTRTVTGLVAALTLSREVSLDERKQCVRKCIW
jgi:hypothetical protein